MKEHGFQELFRKTMVIFIPLAVNRIDRLTSGLVILALTRSKSQKLTDQMMQRDIRKTYLCKVTGEFPTT
jgi:tRNA pseudouridine synthase 9